MRLRTCAIALLTLTLVAPLGCAGQHPVSTPGGGSFTMPVSQADIARAAVTLADETRGVVNFLREATKITDGLPIAQAKKDAISRAAITFYTAADAYALRFPSIVDRAGLIADAATLDGLVNSVLDELKGLGPRIDHWVDLIRVVYIIAPKLIGLAPAQSLSEVF